MYSLHATPVQLHIQSGVLREAGLAHFFGCRWNGPEGERPGGASDPAFLRRGAADILGVPPDALYMGEQVHGEDILVIGGDQPVPAAEGPLPACDGFITDRPGSALAVRTADCVPLILYDPRRRAAAMIHAGWRGTALSIAARGAAHFRNRFSSRLSDLIAVIGPAVGPCCYEVGPEVYQAMATHGWAREAFGPEKDEGRRMLDLAAALRRQLVDQGLAPDNISSLPLCTVCRDDLFYSWRRQGEEAGRQISALLLCPQAKADRGQCR